MMPDTQHVKGLSELDAFLSTLPVKMEKNIMRGAMRAGAKPVQQAIKADIPSKTGQLRAGIKISTNTKGGVITAKVKATGKHANIAPWLEYGTVAHRIVPAKAKSLIFGSVFADGIDHPGILPRATFRVALDTKQTVSVAQIANYIKSRLTKAGINQASEVEIEFS